MLEREKHVRELDFIKHRNDKLKHEGFDYEKNLYSRIFSSAMFGNPTMQTFLTYLQKQTSCMLESTLVVRNFWNYSVDRYWKNHNN